VCSQGLLGESHRDGGIGRKIKGGVSFTPVSSSESELASLSHMALLFWEPESLLDVLYDSNIYWGSRACSIDLLVC